MRFNQQIITTIIFSLFCTGAFGQQPKALVNVTPISLDGKSIYLYSVTNNSSSPIWMIDLGRKQTDDPILDLEPLRVLSPDHWKANSTWLEESNPRVFLVYWKQPETKSLKSVLVSPGTTKSGFKVILPHASPTYLNCPFTVYFVSGGNYSGIVTHQKH